MQIIVVRILTCVLVISLKFVIHFAQFDIVRELSNLLRGWNAMRVPMAENKQANQIDCQSYAGNIEEQIDLFYIDFVNKTLDCFDHYAQTQRSQKYWIDECA